MFIKNPKLSTKKKHKKLETKSLGSATRKKPFVDKKKQERIKAEKELAEGAECWRRHLESLGDPDADTSRTDILFQAFGRPRDPITGRYSNDYEDENHVDFPDENKTSDDLSM
jgi:hypothetical protein